LFLRLTGFIKNELEPDAERHASGAGSSRSEVRAETVPRRLHAEVRLRLERAPRVATHPQASSPGSNHAPPDSVMTYMSSALKNGLIHMCS